MATHPTILGDMIRHQTDLDDSDTTLDADRDLARPTPDSKDDVEKHRARDLESADAPKNDNDDA